MYNSIVVEFEILDDLEDELQDSLSNIAEDSPVKASEVGAANKFVVGYQDGNPASYATIRSKYPKGTSITDYAAEVFQIGVDKNLRGQGLGRETFEEALQQADQYCKEKDFNHIYMSVWEPTTETYQEVKEELREEEGFFSDSEILELAEEKGVEDELTEPNPMNTLAEEYGFDSYEGSSFRNTAHIKERTSPRTETAKTAETVG